jgi:hypothetical protein
VLKKTRFSAFTSVCQVLHGDDVEPLEDIAPEKIPLLKYTPVTACDVERSSSDHKHSPSDKIQSMASENMEKIQIVYCA